MTAQRKCGACTLCCRLVPVREEMRTTLADGSVDVRPTFFKPAMTRCQHQCSTGCRIYSKRPTSCRTWSCAWLALPEGEMLPRPDRCHYVVDVLPDFITITDNDTGKIQEIPILQIWLEPEYPDAHRDPRLRAFLKVMGETRGMAALVRRGNEKTRTGSGLVIFPPSMSADHEWHEIQANLGGNAEHTVAEKERVMAEHGIALAAEFGPDMETMRFTP